MVVVVHDPKLGDYHGGQVAAPVFSKVMNGALRLMNIPPDDMQAIKQRQAANEAYMLRVAGGAN